MYPWLELLKKDTVYPDYSPVLTGIQELVEQSDFNTLDLILSTHHPRYLSLEGSVFLLTHTQPYKDSIPSWLDFLKRSVEHLQSLPIVQ